MGGGAGGGTVQGLRPGSPGDRNQQPPAPTFPLATIAQVRETRKNRRGSRAWTWSCLRVKPIAVPGPLHLLCRTGVHFETQCGRKQQHLLRA